MILDFSNKTQQQKNALIGEGYFYLQEAAKLSKNLEIKETKQSKSSDQLRAIYKLFQLCRPHFQKWKPALDWNLEGIKEFTKAELGYTRDPNSFEIAMMIKQSGFVPKDEEEKKKMVRFCKKIKQNISFADFTKEQALNFVKELEVWAQEKGWSDVYLADEEKQAYIASLEKIYK
mgnify:FL=1|tara:strand:+ start:1176 stop:1700 length:525 start_codon:yes stop_codon:yes gene_type:complete